jgi:hypothetical protein
VEHNDCRGIIEWAPLHSISSGFPICPRCGSPHLPDLRNAVLGGFFFTALCFFGIMVLNQFDVRGAGGVAGGMVPVVFLLC